MTHHSHAVGGVVAGIVVVLVADGAATPTLAGSCIAASVIGALIPDIDHPRAFLARRIPIWFLLRPLLSNPITWWIASGGRLDRLRTGRKKIRTLLSHRGITHSLLAAMATACVIFVLAPLAFPLPAPWPFRIGLAVFAGYLSHLFLDMLTVRGVPLLLPFTSQRFTLVPRPYRSRSR